MSALKHAKAGAKAEAHMYVWAAGDQLLEGGTSPDRDPAAAKCVARVIAIAKSEQQRLLAKYDRALASVNVPGSTALSTVKPPRSLRTQLPKGVDHA